MGVWQRMEKSRGDILGEQERLLAVSGVRPIKRESETPGLDVVLGLALGLLGEAINFVRTEAKHSAEVGMASDAFIRSSAILALTDSRLLLVSSTVRASKARFCLLYTSPSPRDKRQSRMPSSA